MHSPRFPCLFIKQLQGFRRSSSESFVFCAYRQVFQLRRLTPTIHVVDTENGRSKVRTWRGQFLRVQSETYSLAWLNSRERACGYPHTIAWFRMDRTVAVVPAQASSLPAFCFCFEFGVVIKASGVSVADVLCFMFQRIARCIFPNSWGLDLVESRKR